MHKILPLLFLSAAFVLAAGCDAAETPDRCDAPSMLELAPPDGVTLPTITLREQGPPAGIYITELGGEAFFRDEFVNEPSFEDTDAIERWQDACDKSPRLRVVHDGE